MAEDVPDLRRTLFGYRPRTVQQLLADRDTMFGLVQGREQRALSRIAELEADLETIGVDLDTVTAELGQLRSSSTQRIDEANAMRAAAESQLEIANDLVRDRTEQVEVSEAKIRTLELELGTARQELAATEATLLATRGELNTSEGRVRSMEGRATALDDELLVVRARAASVEEELSAARRELEQARIELARRADATEHASPKTTEDLSVILGAAEQGLSGIMERTKKAYAEQLEAAERERRLIRNEIERFSDWQMRVGPRLTAIQDDITETRDRIAAVPRQINEAVGSMIEAIGTLSESLDRLAALPPPIPEPNAHPATSPLDRGAMDVIRLREGIPSEMRTPEGEPPHASDGERPARGPSSDSLGIEARRSIG